MTGHDGMTGETDALATIECHLDRAYLVATLGRLARVPTDVPLGFDTLMAPDDPKLVYYVQEVVRPELVRLGRGERGRPLLIQNYTPA